MIDHSNVQAAGLQVPGEGIRFLKKGAGKAAISVVLLAAVILALATNYDLSGIYEDVRSLSPAVLALVFAALLANALVAVLRFQTIAVDMGHPVSFRRAMATVSASSLAGAMFFQLAGQLIARGIIMARGGVPFASVVVITFFERIVAAILSALVAIGGAYYIFGRIYLDQNAGGAELVKLICGLIAATIAAALLGYGRIAANAILPLLSEHFARTCLRVAGLSLLVQLPMMVAYVAAAHALSPETDMIELVAASAVVMFAASVPISLAGWGVREMSAVVALGTIGVPAHAAFTTALLIGIGSLAAMGLLTAVSVPRTKTGSEVAPQNAPKIDFTKALTWVLPIAAATFVLFQIYVPVGSGLLNVNLADPIALVAAPMFLIGAFQAGRAPQWRVPYVNGFAVFATIILGISLLIGIGNFGVTTWAWVNRFLGWFVLLAYGATGALIVKSGGGEALRIMLRTYVGATAALAAIELALVLVTSAGITLPTAIIDPTNVQAFSQNHNFFAFQLLMATSALLVLDGARDKAKFALLTLILTTFWFVGSRSGWISVAFVLGFAAYLRLVTMREIGLALAGAAAVVLLVTGVKFLPDLWAYLHSLFAAGTSGGAVPTMIVPQIVPDEASSHERMITLIGGYHMFIEHPLFGAGLGAYRHLNILATSGIPLVIHSTALWLLAELGLVGFLIFLIPALRTFLMEWRRARTEAASALIVLCFVAFAVMSSPADMMYQRTFWLLIGAALALPAASPAKDAR